MENRKEKDLIYTWLCERVDNDNRENGFFTNYCKRKLTMREEIELFDNNNYRITDYFILKDNVKVYRIHRKYATRKVNLCYKQLKPTIEYIGG